MSAPWLAELARGIGLVSFCLLTGWVVGRPMGLLLFGVVSYLLWQLISLYRFERWLRHGNKLDPPVTGGIWGELYHHIYRLQDRNRKRKRKLATFLGQFRELTAALPDGAVVLSTDNTIEWFNAAASRLLHLKMPQDIGQRIDNLLRSPACVAFLNSANYSEPLQVASPAPGNTMMLLHIVPYEQEKRLLVARDITRLHRLEAMRRNFVANVSHELATPLTVISGYLETFSDTGDACPAPWGNAVQQMQQQTSRMRHIVDDLLLLSRLELDIRDAPSVDVDVPRLLENLQAEAIALSGAHRHEITLKADVELWLYGNEKDLRSAFSNLVANAVRYTPEGGKIRIGWFADDAGAHFEVSDSGIGIPRQAIPRLTERFYRVDEGRSRASGGTGLGLAIVKHVLNHHDARLRIESIPGRGSTFLCDFPPHLIRRPQA